MKREQFHSLVTGRVVLGAQPNALFQRPVFAGPGLNAGVLDAHSAPAVAGIQVRHESVLRKRKKKMNKHKHRKRLKVRRYKTKHGRGNR